MTVLVNGKPCEVGEGATVADLLHVMLPEQTRGVAVARNGDVVLRAEWDRVMLASGDHIEVLHAVQGG